MPLLDLIENSFDTILRLNIQQVVSNAGDGKLKDDSVCSEELRQYLNRVPTVKLLAASKIQCKNSFNSLFN